MSDKQRTWLFAVLLAFTFLLGAFLRVNRFLFNRSLWYDEALFALNIIERTPLQLVAPLGYGQNSPVGFTLLVKMLTMAFGASEPVLRLVPLLAGLASLPLFYMVARTWLPKWASLLAVILFAASDALGDYAAQFEKYSSDATLTLVLLLVALWFTNARRPTRYFIFGIVGVVAVWLSYSASIVLAGIGITLVFLALQRRSYSEALSVVAMAGVWLLSAAGTWAAAIQPTLGDPGRGIWFASRGGFLTFPPLTIRQLEGDIDTLVHPFEYPLGFALYSGVILLYALGALEVVRKGGTRYFLLAPVLVTIGLAALRLYPMYERAILFLVPLLLLTVVLGIAWLWGQLAGRTERLVALGFLALVWFQPLRTGLARGLNPRELQETRPLMIRLGESYQPGDVVAVYYGAEPAFKYYSALLGLNQVVATIIDPHLDEPELYCEEVEPLAGLARVWVLYSHGRAGPQGPEGSIITGCLDRVGTQVAEFEETGASLHLYDLRQDLDDSEASG